MTYDDTVKNNVRQINSSLAVNINTMTKFIKERFRIQTQFIKD